MRKMKRQDVNSPEDVRQKINLKLKTIVDVMDSFDDVENTKRKQSMNKPKEQQKNNGIHLAWFVGLWTAGFIVMQLYHAGHYGLTAVFSLLS